jgi:hypothetical protein
LSSALPSGSASRASNSAAHSIGLPISFSIDLTYLASGLVTMVKAAPLRPARPVRPMRWT